MLGVPPPLDTLVMPGAVTERSARIWLRRARSGPILLRVAEEGAGSPFFEREVDLVTHAVDDFTGVVSVPDDVPGLAALPPSTDLRVTVLGRRDGELVGEARFRTSPLGVDDTPAELTFAIASCNQPFQDDGKPSPRARVLARLLPDALRAMDVSRLLLVGDQMYTDAPSGCSLFDERYFATVAPRGRASILDCSRVEVRSLLQARYRNFWKLPEMQQLLSGWAGVLVADDHEIVDNFGSAPVHATPRYRNLRDGALDAFYDYQGSRALPRTSGHRPETFDHASFQGSIAFFAADLRSEKLADEARTQLMSERQLAALERFLAGSRGRHVIVVILSLPILHVPDWMPNAAAAIAGHGSDAADRWSYEKARGDQERLLGLLARHQEENPRQRIVLASGDVHVGVASQFAWGGAPRPILQLASSALTNEHGPWLDVLAKAAPLGDHAVGHVDGRAIVGSLLPGIDGLDDNPFGALNVGTVHVRRIGRDESTVRLRLHAARETDRGVELKCVFDSGEL